MRIGPIHKGHPHEAGVWQNAEKSVQGERRYGYVRNVTLISRLQKLARLYREHKRSQDVRCGGALISVVSFPGMVR